MRRFCKHLTQVGGVTGFIAFALVGAGAEPGAAERDWSFEVAPYLWVAGIELETSLPNLPPSTPNVDRFDTRIRAGAMLAAQARYRSVGLFVDFAWLRLDTEAIQPGPAFSAVDLCSDFIHSTAALTYRLPTSAPACPTARANRQRTVSRAESLPFHR